MPLTEPLGSVEPWLKNTDVSRRYLICISMCSFSALIIDSFREAEGVYGFDASNPTCLLQNRIYKEQDFVQRGA